MFFYKPAAGYKELSYCATANSAKANRPTAQITVRWTRLSRNH